MPGRALPSVLASLVALSAFAQSTPPAENEKPTAPPPPRTLTIFVPYKDLAQAMGGEIPGVYLPYDEFLELWGRTYPEAPVPPPPPPGESAIGDVAIEGVVAGDSVAWKAALKVTTRARGWSEVGIAFAGAAIEKVEVEGAPEAIVRPLDGGGYALLVPRAGTYSARLELATGVIGEGDARVASLAAPRAAIARARVTIDETRVRPSIERALAAAVEEADGKTSVLGLLPAGGPVVVRWNRQPAEFDPGKEGYLFTTVAAASTIAPEVERLSARVEGRVMRAALRSVRVRLPDGFTLLAASGDGVTGATPEADGRLLVVFDRPRDAFDIALRLERPRPIGEREVALAAPSVEAATRETTFLAAAPAGDLRARLVAAERAERVEPADWPGGESARPPGSLLFRRLAPDARVALAIEEAAPRVAAALDERLEIAGAGARLFARAKLEVTDAGLFDVRFDAPAGWTVEDVGPKEVVRERRVEEIAGRLAITASLRARAKGSVALDVSLRRDGDPVAAPIAAPIVRVAGAEREDLVLSVAVEDALNVKVASVAGFDPVDAASLPADRLPPPAHPETMAFRSSGRSAELTLAAERRTARVVAATRASIAVEEDRLALRSTILFTVQYAARDSFTLLVPESIEPTLDLAAARLKEKTRVGPSATRPGFAEWRVTLQAPMTGDVAISVAGEAPLRRPAAGAAATVDAPLVFAAGVERETGHVALSRASNLEIEPRAEALEPIDPRELPAELAGDGVVLAWRYVAAPASLRLEVKRHDYQPVIDSAVTHLHVDTVVAASGLCRSVALLEARNTARQYLETLLPEGSTLLAAEVNGSPVRPNRRPGEPALLVPIPLTEAGGAPAGVRLLYETRLGDDAPTGIFGRVTVTAPRFAGVPVLRTTIRAYLPEDLVALAYGGGARALADRGDFLAWTSSCPTLSRLGFLERPAVLSAAAAARPGPRPAGDAASGGSYALDLDIAREGREHLFATLDGDALASVTWASAGFFSFLRVLAFALPIALGVLLVRKKRVQATPYVLLSALLLALLAPLAPAGLLLLLDAALFGVAAFALASMAIAVIAFLRANAKSYERAPARPEGGAA